MQEPELEATRSHMLKWRDNVFAQEHAHGPNDPGRDVAQMGNCDANRDNIS